MPPKTLKIFAVIILWMISCTISLQAQEKELAIKYSASGLIDFYVQYIQFAAEYKWNADHSVELELGHAFRTGVITTTPDMDLIGGFKARLGWRKYFSETEFFGITTMFRSEQFDVAADFSRKGAAYFQRINYEVDQFNIGLLATLGENFHITERLFIESSGGLGLRYIDRRYEDLPSDVEFVTNSSLFANYQREPEQRLSLSLFFSIKLGYWFRLKN
ncbi:MAG: hypothetical protein MRY78_20395 [Saprospiraceae bacterium]|nr:hypothetical protein [Saprospiraceae bacterium]